MTDPYTIVQSALMRNSLDTLPINEESLRPVLMCFFEAAREMNEAGLMCFDFEDDPEARTDKIYFGIPVPIQPLKPATSRIHKIMTDAGLAKEFVLAKPSMDTATDDAAVLYFANLYVPTAALAGMTN